MTAALDAKVVALEGRVGQVEQGHIQLVARVGTLEEKALKDIGRILEGQKRVEERVATYTEITFAKVAAINEDRRQDAELIAQLHADVREALLPRRDKLPSLSEYSPTVNEDGSASRPPGALDSMRENVARQRAEVEAKDREVQVKQRALELAEAARTAMEKALAQVRADRQKERDEQRAEEEARRVAQAAIDDARIARIKKWAALVTVLAASTAGGITWAYHLWLAVHH